MNVHIYSESLVRYRLLSEPELSSLLKTTISNHSIQSSQQSSHRDESSDLDMPKCNVMDQKNNSSSCTTSNNDKKSQNRSNNNMVQA